MAQPPSSLACPAAHALLRASPPGPPWPPVADASLVRPTVSRLNSASFCLVNSNPWLPFLQGAYTCVSLDSLITRTISSPLCTFLGAVSTSVCSMSPYKISEHLFLPRCVVNWLRFGLRQSPSYQVWPLHVFLFLSLHQDFFIHHLFLNIHLLRPLACLQSSLSSRWCLVDCRLLPVCSV